MKTSLLLKTASLLVLTLVLLAPLRLSAAEPAIDSATPVVTWSLPARIVAVGLPGVAGLRQVGRFHNGGAIPGNPEFLLSTSAGRVLDPERVLVAVASNFGAPLGEATHAAGAVLSIDPRTPRTLVVPERFAAAGSQSSEAAGGAIRLYSAQSLAFANGRYNGQARTSAYAAASGPRYISINNAFGRPWIANAPAGSRGPGSVSVVDPDGAPLDNAPSGDAGGVFAGGLTNRRWAPQGGHLGWIERWFTARPSAQLTPGAIGTGALGTAFLGPSPDGSGLAVFAVVTADGAVVQVHVRDGVDGLAAAGTVGGGDGVDIDPGVMGIAFKWNPERVLYLADLLRDRIVRLHLGDDGRHFTLARTSAIASAALRQPVDIAAALPEIANPRFASHTTLAGGSDLYVANRGDGSLLRMSQDGQVLARAEIEVPGLGTLAANRLRAIAVSADAQRIWVTVEGELPGHAGHAGALIEVSAFDATGPFGYAAAHMETGAPREVEIVETRASRDLVQTGQHAFSRVFTPQEGLGPLFNARACATCHPGPGGGSASEAHFARRVAQMDPITGRVAPIDHPNSPVARRFSTRAFDQGQAPAPDLPRRANIVSLRMPPPLFAIGRLDEIPDAVIEAQAVSRGDGIKGRVHVVTTAGGEQRVGRYGWKGQIATLDDMVADAFATELGITSALASPPPLGPRPPVEDDGELVRAVAAYLRSLGPGREAAR